jgi:hypothetical protein
MVLLNTAGMGFWRIPSSGHDAGKEIWQQVININQDTSKLFRVGHVSRFY